MTVFERVGVLGFGTMGAGIAQLAAASGRHVIVLETDTGRLDAGTRAVSSFLQRGIERGKVTETDKNAVLSRITGTTDLADLADVELVIEAVTEQREVKRELLARVSETLAGDAVFATNTSALSVSDLATAVTAPGRFAGLHFFNPAPLMKIVEVVQGLASDDDVLARLEEFVSSLGKQPIRVKDGPGFLVNRLLMPYLNDVIQAYDEELASAEDIDTALKLGLGYKLGPLELLDMIGLDVHNHATMSAYQTTLDPAYAPPPLLQRMVAAGLLGNKTGQGFRRNEAGA
jgi:3-hydroxybutyryl-CoA dehydrogenase